MLLSKQSKEIFSIRLWHTNLVQWLSLTYYWVLEWNKGYSAHYTVWKLVVEPKYLFQKNAKDSVLKIKVPTLLRTLTSETKDIQPIDLAKTLIRQQKSSVSWCLWSKVSKTKYLIWLLLIEARHFSPVDDKPSPATSTTVHALCVIARKLKAYFNIIMMHTQEVLEKDCLNTHCWLY